MGVLKMFLGTIIFIFTVMIIMQPLVQILDATSDIRNTASNTSMYGTTTDGQVIEVGKANAGGDLTNILLFGVGLFMTIGFIVWLVMRAPVEPDYGYDQPPLERRF